MPSKQSYLLDTIIGRNFMPETQHILTDYLSPVSPSDIIDLTQLNINQLGHQVNFYKGGEITKAQCELVIIGVSIGSTNAMNTKNINGVEHDANIGERAYQQPVDTDPTTSSTTNKPYNKAANAIRKELYQLYSWQDRMKVMDLGNIKQGKTPKDTLVAFETVVQELLQNNIKCIILGDTQELTYHHFKAYEGLQMPTSVAVIDERIDLGEQMTDQSYLYKLFAHRPHFLENYMQLGYQSFLVNPNQVEVLRKKHLECYRLGYLLEDLKRIEPLLRNTDMISLDVAALRYADAPAQSKASPNGFSAHDICKIGRYAGISDKVSSFGIYEYQVDKDQNQLTAQLLAQTIWHFISGYYDRYTEIPDDDSKDFIFHTVTLNEHDDEMKFVKSLRTGRWWMKVPLLYNDEKNFELIPCTEEEYETACRCEIPERWMQAFVKYSSK